MSDDLDIDIDAIVKRMDGALNSLKHDFSTLRTGRASASMLDTISVDAYGAMTPINQVATVNVPEPRMISVNVWDKSMVQAVDKAIRNSGLGINPVMDGTTLRLPIPELNEERRRDLTKVASTYTENARISVRNIRRYILSDIKELQKEKEITEDEERRAQDDVQKITDSYIAKIDQALSVKEKDLMEI